VHGAVVSLERGDAVVDFDPGCASAADLVSAVDAAGYRAQQA
jgi:copper chaperone CopZ